MKINCKKIAYICMTAIVLLALSLPVLADTIFIESESGVMDSANPMQIGSGEGAFGGSYIYGSERGVQKISYEFEIAEAGDYYIWFRLQAIGSENNSILVSVDGKGFNADNQYDFDMWEETIADDQYELTDNNPFIPAWDDLTNIEWTNYNWHWTPLNYRDGNVRFNLVTLNLSAGKHTIDVWPREPEAMVDKMIITNNLSYDPRAIEGDPEPIYLAELAAAEAAKAAEEAAAAAEAAAQEAAEEAVPAPAPAPEVQAPSPTTADNALGFVLLAMLTLAGFSFSQALRRKKQR